MADTIIVRGDSYGVGRYLFHHELAQETGDPYDLTGCTVRTTFKTVTVDPNTDTTDSTAVIKGTLIVNGSGTPTTQTNLYLVGAAADGAFDLRLSTSDTLALPLAQTWYSDVELTDNLGEVRTFFFVSDAASAVDGYTNRTSG